MAVVMTMVVVAEVRAVVTVGTCSGGSGSDQGDVRTMTVVMADVVTEETGDRDDGGVMTMM